MHAVDHYITVNGPIQLASLGRMSILMLRGCEYEPKLGHTEDFLKLVVHLVWYSALRSARVSCATVCTL